VSQSLPEQLPLQARGRQKFKPAQFPASQHTDDVGVGSPVSDQDGERCESATAVNRSQIVRLWATSGHAVSVKAQRSKRVSFTPAFTPAFRWQTARGFQCRCVFSRELARTRPQKLVLLPCWFVWRMSRETAVKCIFMRKIQPTVPGEQRVSKGYEPSSVVLVSYPQKSAISGISYPPS